MSYLNLLMKSGNFGNVFKKLSNQREQSPPLKNNGNVGIGTTGPTEALVVVGNANITGTLYKGTTAYTNPDIAEKIPSTQLLEEGDLVVADENNNNHVVKSTKQYQNVIGVVSPNASLVIGNWRGGFEGYNIALLGRVAIKISLENGPIKRGDALTLSSIEGFAMKATQSGRIIGYAMEDYKENVRTHKIMVFVQSGWYSVPGEVAQVQQPALPITSMESLGYSKINGSVMIRLG